jgi:bile acid-coenzyme A ligase
LRRDPVVAEPTRTRNVSAVEPISYGRRLTQMAAERPEGSAFIFVSQNGSEHDVSWRELDEASNRVARLLDDHGVGQGSTVVTALPNSVAHVVAMYGAWKAGACVLPLRWDLPEWERERVLEVARPTVVIGDWEGVTGMPVLHSSVLEASGYSSDPVADRVPAPAKAIATSGSTGTPKIIVLGAPGEAIPGEPQGAAGEFLGHRDGQVQLVPAPLYHANGFYVLQFGLFGAQQIILMERFVAGLAIDLIERHRVNTFCGVTIMFQRMAREPDIETRDFSSLESVLHGGAPLPEWVARKWIELVGPAHFFVSYGSSENAGIAMANGEQWLAHPGTVGKPFNTVARILDDEGVELPPSEVGEIYLRWIGQTENSFEYSGQVQARRNAEGFSSLGDLGWLDDDGFLFLADRRTDMIITGGANVYPAEVEAALSEHSDVVDCAVVGVADPEWGSRVHAVIQLRGGATATADDLRAHCRQRVAPYKVPKTFEFTEQLPRSAAGKLRRTGLGTPAA